MAQARRKKPDMKEMTFLDHLDELRTRLIIMIVAVTMGTVACFFVSRHALVFITSMSEVKLLALAPQTPFMVLIKLAMVMGVAVASPVILLQIWLFVAPGLYPHERRYVWPAVITGVVLFLLGGAFALFTIPLSLRFLEQFGAGYVVFTYDINRFVSFVGGFILAFGAVFQLPIVLFFLARIGVVDYAMLAGNRKFAFVAALIVGAVLTPADIFSMTVLAVPLYALFEASLIVIRFTKPPEPDSGE